VNAKHYSHTPVALALKIHQLHMLVILLIVFLLALWAFIVWERRRNIPPVSRTAMARGWSVSPLAKWHAHAGLSAVSAAMAANTWVNPSHPPFTGRLSSVVAFAYAQFGPHGEAYLWGTVAIALAVFALAQWRVAVLERRGSGISDR
jgi:hypothetical protein